MFQRYLPLTGMGYLTIGSSLKLAEFRPFHNQSTVTICLEIDVVVRPTFAESEGHWGEIVDESKKDAIGKKTGDSR